MSKGVSILDKGIFVNGNILSDSSIDVCGIINGNIFTKSVFIKSNGNVCGDIFADEVILTEGSNVEGRIIAKKITMLKGCNINGIIMYNILSIEDGSKIVGQVNFSDQDSISKIIEENKNKLFTNNNNQ